MEYNKNIDNILSSIEFEARLRDVNERVSALRRVTEDIRIEFNKLREENERLKNNFCNDNKDNCFWEEDGI